MFDSNGTAGTLSLKQQFQAFAGTIRTGDKAAAVTAGRLIGDALTFTVGSAKYMGKVHGDTIEGTTAAGVKWKAKRPVRGEGD